MKSLLTKNPALVVGSWFAVMFVVALLLSSCATGYVGCDAYGKIDKKTGIGHQVMTVEKANEMAK